MAFIQIIDFRTDRFDEGRAAIDEYREKTQGRRTATRSVLGRDRDEANHFVNIVFFDSYEEAMKNSELPETRELANKLHEMTSEPPTFLNLEVEWDQD